MIKYLLLQGDGRLDAFDVQLADARFMQAIASARVG